MLKRAGQALQLEITQPQMQLLMPLPRFRGAARLEWKGKLEARANKLEKGVGGFLKKLEKKYG